MMSQTAQSQSPLSLLIACKFQAVRDIVEPILYINFPIYPSARSQKTQNSIFSAGCPGQRTVNLRVTKTALLCSAKIKELTLLSWLINRGYTFFEIFLYNIVGTNQFLIGLLVFFYMTYQVTILQTCERDNTVQSNVLFS